MPQSGSVTASRRALLAGACAMGVVSVATPRVVRAKDYASRRELFDDLDRLSAVCGMRLGALGRERSNAAVLVSRFLAALERYRATREDSRRRFGLPGGVDPGSMAEPVDGDLKGLRQALDDLMVAYAEGLPALGDAGVVARLAADMVDVSRLRTVIDLWAVSEGD